MIISIDEFIEKKQTMGTIVCASGFFGPIHIGHLEYLQKAKNLGDTLVVIVNSDKQTLIKKGKIFMNQEERAAIVDSLRFVDYVIIAFDDDISVRETIRGIHPDYFAKGGDRFATEIPEAKVCQELGIQMVDGLGQKIQSSSWIVADSKLMPDC